MQRYENKSEVYYLLSYSPELNPDEYLTCDLKARLRSSSPAHIEAELQAKIHGP